MEKMTDFIFGAIVNFTYNGLQYVGICDYNQKVPIFLRKNYPVILAALAEENPNVQQLINNPIAATFIWQQVKDTSDIFLVQKAQ